jgi:hypothetical protein
MDAPIGSGNERLSTERKAAPADDEVRQNYFALYLKQGWEDIQTSTDDFDKNLLAVSSGALGVSLAFIKDVVPLATAVWLPALYISWAAFALCVLVTLTSFQLSIHAGKRQLDIAREYYIEKKTESLKKKNWATKAVKVSTIVSGVMFFIGLVCTLCFCEVNVHRRASIVQQSTKHDAAPGISVTVGPTTFVEQETATHKRRTGKGSAHPSNCGTSKSEPPNQKNP